MYSSVFSAALDGVEGVLVRLEAAQSDSLPKIQVIGLPTDLVKESCERVQASLRHFGFRIPSGKTVIHLSPADAKKHGSHFDVALAMSLLGVERPDFNEKIKRTAFLGEMDLDGKIHSVPSILALAEVLSESDQVDCVVVPKSNLNDVRLLGGKKFRLVSNLKELLEFLRGEAELSEVELSQGSISSSSESPSLKPVWDQVVGNRLAKRMLQIAIAGGHHCLLIGPPGVGKTMLAYACQELLPKPHASQWIRILKNWGAAGKVVSLAPHLPFRSPHHTISVQGLLGGGSGGRIQPGEVTLADGGVLFLDEMAEFRRDALDGLREPLQEGKIYLNRIGKNICLPARFVLITTLNPCPCGMSLSKVRCRCGWERVLSYRRRISGPILDRLSMGVVVSSSVGEAGDSSSFKRVSQSVNQVREIQEKRFGSGQLNANAAIEIGKGPFELETEILSWCEQIVREKGVSLRSVHQLIRVARTIADLENKERIGLTQLKEAWGLRCPDLFSPPW